MAGVTDPRRKRLAARGHSEVSRRMRECRETGRACQWVPGVGLPLAVESPALGVCGQGMEPGVRAA